MLKQLISDLRLLRIDALSIVIYYPFIRIVYQLSLIFPKITPNFVTIFGLLQFLLISTLFIFSKDPRFLSIGLMIFALADVCDGFLARKSGLTSKVGAILDIVSDRFIFFLFSAQLGFYHLSVKVDINSAGLLFAYCFSFIFLDTIHLIAQQAKQQLGISNQIKDRKNKWWLNQEFRFTSYLFISIWIFDEKNHTWAAIAISMVFMDYLSYGIKSINTFRKSRQ
ncbi:CDP-alcohol phosphatidyltransferase family protein [Hydrogenophaga sp. NFH-34]|uniref:CDP-alcohol phosphatidyltransferase family protein n=1 Tax=Hydrogenophaga sp. NFH-34 TaxID=2744446 RepID=UPI003FA3CC44